MERKFNYQNFCLRCKKTFVGIEEEEYCDECKAEIQKMLKRKTTKQKDKKKEKKVIKSYLKLPSPKLNYKFELFNLTSKNLSKFVFPDNRRKLKGTQLASLYKSLLNNRHFDSPIVVNEVEKVYRILDGNHRMDTFKRILKRYPKFKLSILLITYKNLDGDGEIQAFRRWNTGKTQTCDDFIQSIAKQIPIISWFKDDFPIDIVIYKTPKTMSIRNLCGAYIAAKNYDDTGYGLKRDSYAENLKELDDTDFKFMKKWCEIFKDVFGHPEQGNYYYSTTFFTATTYVVYLYEKKEEDNSIKDLIEPLRDKIVGNEEIQEYSKFVGREANRKMISLLKNKLRLKV